LCTGFSNQVKKVHGYQQHHSAWRAPAQFEEHSVEIPRNTLTVITGLSGSGKSSLAFDTIMPKASAAMWKRFPHMHASFSTRWNART